MNQVDYERDLIVRQKAHLKAVETQRVAWQPCAHDSCPDCVGTGVKRDGASCVHMMTCPCPKCSPSMNATGIGVQLSNNIDNQPGNKIDV